MIKRTTDTYQKEIYDFIYDIYVVCPSCSKKSIVLTSGFKFNHIDENLVKLICNHCGFNKRLSEIKNGLKIFNAGKDQHPRVFIVGSAIDPYFNQQLWLTHSCCNELLWAYNYDHLNFLEKHIDSKLRERDTENIRNKSIGSRLPKWMTSKKNREIVLKTIKLLKLK